MSQDDFTEALAKLHVTVTKAYKVRARVRVPVRRWQR
jgi:hypothetical protein